MRPADRLGSGPGKSLSGMCEIFASSDTAESLSPLAANASCVQADPTELDAMLSLREDADRMVHCGAIGRQAPFVAVKLGKSRITQLNLQ